MVKSSAVMVTGKKKKKTSAEHGETGGNMIFQSPWAITKKVKKPIDPADAIMENRIKAGAGAEAGPKKKKRKLGEGADEGVPGEKKKKKKMVVSEERYQAHSQAHART